MLDLDNPNPRMLLSSGIEFDPADLSTLEISPRDITHALPRIQRFGGHTHRPLNVAQHSMHVADLVTGIEPKWRLEALLHDASEAYLGDMPKPLKNVLPEYQMLEKQVALLIRKRFDLDPKAAPLVKQMDSFVCELELQWHKGEPVAQPAYLDLNVSRAFHVEVFDALAPRIIEAGAS